MKVKRWWRKGQPVWHHPLYWTALGAFVTGIVVGPPSRSWPWPWFLYLVGLAAIGWLGWKQVDWNS